MRFVPFVKKRSNHWITSSLDIVGFLHFGWDPFLSIRIPPMVSISWMQDLFIDLVGDRDFDTSRVGFLCYMWWYIWKARNKFVLEGEELNPTVTIKLAVEVVGEFVDREPLDSRPVMVDHPSLSHWSRSSISIVKVNCDGAFYMGNEGVVEVSFFVIGMDFLFQVALLVFWVIMFYLWKRKLCFMHL